MSLPPKFQFLRDAGEKLYRWVLTEEAMRTRKSSPSQVATKGNDGHITIGGEEELRQPHAATTHHQMRRRPSVSN